MLRVFVTTCVISCLVSCQPEEEPPSRVDPDPEAAVARGETLYVEFCSMCHGVDGEGYTADYANQLNNAHFLRSATDAFLFDSTEKGRPGTPMAAWGAQWGGVLSQQEMRDIVAYIRSWQKDASLNLDDAPIEGSGAAARDLYAANCAYCHGAEGEGVTALSLNNPWFLEQASDAFIRYAIAEGRPGTTMPAFQDRLTDEELNDLTALIRGWQTEPPAQPPPFEADLSDHLINPEGSAAEFTLREDRFIPADEIHAAIQAGEKLVLLDARTAGDYIISHIEGATSAPFYRIDEAIDVMPSDVWIITYCGCPHAISGRALDELRAAGFEKSGILDEGFYVWEDRGYPILRGRERFP
ncbi:MAG: hypothetical protein CMH50_01130 [Myxococcales bacterium]|nr:hypothetical protein [Myxococcales bacterium]